MKFIKTKIDAIKNSIDRGTEKLWRATGIPNAIEKKASALRGEGRLVAASCWQHLFLLLGSALVTLFNIHRFIFGSSGWLEHLIPVLVMLLAWLKTGVTISDTYRRFETKAQEDAKALEADR